MNKIEKAFNFLLNEEYISPTDMKYNNHYDLLLTPHEFDELLEYKKSQLNNKKYFEVLGLKTPHNTPLFFAKCKSIEQATSEYLEQIKNDLDTSSSSLSLRNSKELLLSRIYSEIEGSLNVENVPTTRKRIKELIENKAPAKSRNDTIIKNMNDGINFILEKPAFNKDNLLKLYSYLSHDCLEEDNKLKPGAYYRHDGVTIDNYDGCLASLIEEHMDSLFKFVNDNLNNKELKLHLPHIVHYYMVYIHPYFDYNGRTSRMCSLWISLLTNQEDYIPPFISEAIDQTKTKYYKALRNSRDTNNDLTYFLLYIYRVSISYFLCYKNIEIIENDLKNKDIILSSADKNYIKKILISNNGKFAYKDFMSMCHVEMSKQGALKLLNKFVEYGILKSNDTKSKVKLFEINEDMITYKMSSF